MTDDNPDAGSCKVQIGDWTAEYHAFETTAPVRYDAGDTLTMHTRTEGKATIRLVLIEKRNIEWSRGRYGSGMYALTQTDIYCPAHIIQDMLVNKLLDHPRPDPD